MPVLEGSNGPVSDVRAALAAADVAGYPVLLKAAAGGGGRGMRRVEHPADLPAAFDVAQREAEAAFSDGGLYVERMLEGARHVEIQVLADGLGGVLLCGDRECSIQRRHQKLVEEAPAPHFPRPPAPPCRRPPCGPQGLGLPQRRNARVPRRPGGRLLFLELNARLQVEHPVTELVTGLDLVAEQLQVAAGGRCRAPGWSRPTATPSSAASTPRTRPATSAPGAGRLDDFRIAQGPGIRVDTHCEPGELVPPHYDSLLGKLCVWATDRPRAIARLRRALDETSVTGIPTTLPLLWDIAMDAPFVEGRYTTSYLTERAPFLPSLRQDPAR